MSATSPNTVFDGLLDVLANNVDRNAVLNFRISNDSQSRLDELLEKNRDGLSVKQRQPNCKHTNTLNTWLGY